MFLILNSGSSSLKLQIIDQKSWQALYKANADGISLKTGHYHEEIKNKSTSQKIYFKNHEAALDHALKKIIDQKIIKNLNQIKAIGHRVVHGGEKYRQPVVINPTIIKEIKRLSAFAPLHNPANLEGIFACQKLLKNIPEVAVFDTAFHTTMPNKAYLYALPQKFYTKDHLRRYGFHGTSHKYVSQQAIDYLKSSHQPWQKIISCHLGNGCSVTAIKNGQSIDTSMGFTPLEGLVMGTRSGDIDAGLLYYLHQQKKLTPKAIDHILNHASGLLGLSNLSSDVRTLRDAWFNKKNPAAKLALDIFCYRLAKYISAYLSSLNGLDCLVFTAGIGEHAWYIRRWVCAYFRWLQLKVDDKKNQKNNYDISHSTSKIKVLVIPTNEELQIAQEISPLTPKR